MEKEKENWEKDVMFYGFSPVPRDPDVLFAGHPTASPDNPNPKQDLLTADDFPLPDSELVRGVKEFVKVRPQVCALCRLSN
jgi:cyanamide hydratase